ncbi:MAG: ATP-binding protein, partial [Bacteroidota bacterium]
MANDHLIIENLLAGTGRRNVELIPQWDPLYLGQVVCGFLNGEGGDVILGINASGEVQGIQSDWTKRINQQIIGKIVPDAPISVTQIPFRSGAVILVSSWSGGRKPYSFRGKIYTTEAGETRLATLSEMKTLNLKRRDSNYHWERQVIPGIEPEELDGYEIRESIESYRKLHPGQPKLSAEDFLFRTGLLKEDGLTNAAVILFSNQPARYLPQCRVRATIYSSEKGGNEIYFDRIFERNLFRNIHSIWDFFDTQLQRSRVISSLKRTDEKLPILALREGLLNALIHRDYSSVSSSVNIEVFPDRLQITNTGDFPPEISTSTLRREHRSILRNPDISYICYLRGYIEMLGTGTLRMISNCESLGYEGPIWEPKPHSIKLIMNGVGHGLKKKIDFRGDKNVGVNVGVNDGEEKNVGVNVGVNDGEEKNVGVNVGVNDGEEKNVGVNVGVNDG